MPHPEIHDDGTVTFTLTDGSRVTAEVDPDGLWLHAEAKGEGYAATLDYTPNAMNTGCVTVRQVYSPVERSPAGTATR
jgi:hypothetical protein